MTARHLQNLLAFIFLGLGGWCVLLPGQVERLALQPDYLVDNATSHVLMGCFGAQAILCGTVIAFSNFTARTFLIFGLVGSLPFFAFNYYLTFIVPMFSPLMLLDFAGNTAILLLCLLGYRLKTDKLGE